MSAKCFWLKKCDLTGEAIAYTQPPPFAKSCPPYDRSCFRSLTKQAGGWIAAPFLMSGFTNEGEVVAESHRALHDGRARLWGRLSGSAHQPQITAGRLSDDGP